MRRITAWTMVLLALLTACGGERPFVPEDVQTLLEAGLFDGEMAEADAYVTALLYGVREDTLQDCACYIAANTAASCDEVAVLVLTDEEAARTAEAACEMRIASLLEDARRYTPAAVPRLEAAVIRRVGSTVLLAVGDPDRLAGAVDGLR